MIFRGLSSEEAQRRLKFYGTNEIRRIKRPSALSIFLAQFKSPIMVIMILAAIVSLTLAAVEGEQERLLDAVLILGVVLVSAYLGFRQEHKAEKAVEALQAMAAPRARVMRDGKEQVIEAAFLVPGDIVLLEGGDIIPADAKLLEAWTVQVDESILTGESIAVRKKDGDDVYMNTSMLTGRAVAKVTRTGMRTEIGKIATRIQEIEEERAPFQEELVTFSRELSKVILLAVAIVGLVGCTKFELHDAALMAIALAVAAIPSGLPAAITYALALGGWEMAKKKALVRKLAMIESIGEVDVICTDKTGTLTKNEMSVVKLCFNDKELPADRALLAEKGAEMLLTCAALCNNVRVTREKEELSYTGDQTEVAIRRFADKLGFEKEGLERIYPRVDEIPFTPERKMMSVICRKGDEYYVFTKGAPELVLERCDRVLKGGVEKPIAPEDKRRILEHCSSFAREALRVLGFAYRRSREKPSTQEAEQDLCWLGVEGLIDPPRPEVEDALKDCYSAGTRVLMLTGDNPETARTIAERIGLRSRGVILGEEVDELSDSELEKRLEEGFNIFARVSPFHKLRILELLQRRYRVAMTGDGVNDVLALKKAHVGIGMGVRGSEVAKQVSHILLLDDNFATIRSTIEEGRRVFDNIQRATRYLLSCNFAEVAVIFLATIFLAYDEPLLLPAQLLWINMITDALPAVMLGKDPARPGIMRRPPRPKGTGIITKKILLSIVGVGILLTALLFTGFFLTLPYGFEVARTTLFTGFVLLELIRATAIRYQDKLGLLSNRSLIYVLLASIAPQFVLIYFEPTRHLFHLAPLDLYCWGVLLGLAALSFCGAIGIIWLVEKL